jgi:hypothetical protein
MLRLSLLVLSMATRVALCARPDWNATVVAVRRTIDNRRGSIGVGSRWARIPYPETPHLRMIAIIPLQESSSE